MKESQPCTVLPAKAPNVFEAYCEGRAATVPALTA